MSRFVLIATVILLVTVAAILEMNSSSGWTPGWIGRSLVGSWSHIDRQEDVQRAQMKQVFDGVHGQNAAAMQGASDRIGFEKDHSLPGIVTGAVQGDPRTISPLASTDPRFNPQDVYAQSKDISNNAKEQQERLKQQQQDQMRGQVKK